MSSRLSVAMVCAALSACNPNVLVGYATLRDSGASAAVSGDAGALDAAMHRDSGNAALDAGRPSDAGSAAADAAPEPLPKVSWSSGAHAGNDLQQYLDFGNWRGRPLDIAHVYVDRTHGWDGLVSPGWPVDMFGSFSGKLLISAPLYPEGMGNNQDCAAGNYDAEWRKLGTFLTARNRPDTILRLGWGGNDLNHAWRADSDPTAWLTCFRRVVTAVRATDSRVQIDWCFNPIGAPNVMPGDPYALYPGDAYVDFIDVEIFDRYPPSTTPAQWTSHCNAATGLCSVIAFARKHGKKLGLGEWGTSACGDNSGGDNPFFVRHMVATFAANLDVMGYEAYFDADSSDVCAALWSGSHNPNASALYKAIYSAR